MWRDDLALKPNEGEIFFKEVDEELRKERVNSFVARFGWWIVAAIVLALGAVGGWIWWQGRQEAQAAAQGEVLLEALDSLEAGNRAAATPKIAELLDSDRPGYRAAALFARANSETAAGNAPAAIATLRSIAADESLDESYRSAALVRQTQLEYDGLQPQIVVQRLRPLTQPGSPWLGTAGEMLGVAYLKMRRPDLAGPLFGQIGRDEAVPESIRNRAVQMAGSLGVEALDDPTPTPTGRPAAPASQPAPAAPPAAATRDKAE
jgi:hypothetical protein